MAKFQAVATPAGGVFALALSVGLASGDVRRFLVGDPQIQVFDVLAGRTLDRLVAAERLAATGEVVADASIAGYPDSAVQVIAWRADIVSRESFAVIADCRRPRATPISNLREGVSRYTPPISNPQSPITDSWLHPAVFARLASSAQFVAELRLATALMLQFSGIAYDAENSAGVQLNAYVCWVQQVLARYEGMLIDITMGDRESYLYAVFGAPVAHDDDATRAVAADLELRQPPADLSFVDVTRIGIAQGQMRCGIIGGTTWRAYAVLGDPANLAFRLMHLAPPGEIRCDDPTYRRARQRLVFETMPPVRVKGKAGLIRFYRPVGDFRLPVLDFGFSGAVIPNCV